SRVSPPTALGCWALRHWARSTVAVEDSDGLNVRRWAKRAHFFRQFVMSAPRVLLERCRRDSTDRCRGPMPSWIRPVGSFAVLSSTPAVPLAVRRAGRATGLASIDRRATRRTGAVSDERGG